MAQKLWILEQVKNWKVGQEAGNQFAYGKALLLLSFE